jgi:hypothetical protein
MLKLFEIISGETFYIAYFILPSLQILKIPAMPVLSLKKKNHA